MKTRPFSKGINYARNQQKRRSSASLGDGRLPAHNNWSERELRREAVGRKNWILPGKRRRRRRERHLRHPRLASCQMHDIEPWSYLRDLLCLLPSWPRRRVLELAPAHWNKTTEQQDAQQRLAANIFRPVTFGVGDDHRQDK